MWVYLRFLLVHPCITGSAVRTDYKVDIGNRDPDDLRPSRGLSDAHIGGGRLIGGVKKLARILRVESVFFFLESNCEY